MERLSYSQLNSWTSCGQQYWLERIVQVPQRPAWALIGGNAVHEATEEHDLRAHGVDVPERSFEEIFEALTVKAEEESGMSRTEFRASGRASAKWPEKETSAWWLHEGPAMVNRWINWTRNAPYHLWITPDGKPAVELEFMLHLPGARVAVKGFIDRVYQDARGDIYVGDIKTGTSTPASPRQLGGYKVALQEMYPGLPVRFGFFWDARKGASTPPVPLNEFTMRRMEWQYGVLKEARRKGLYLPAPSNMCSSCSVAPYCYEVGGEKAGEVRPPWITIEEWESGDVA